MMKLALLTAEQEAAIIAEFERVGKRYLAEEAESKLEFNKQIYKISSHIFLNEAPRVLKALNGTLITSNSKGELA